MDDCSENDLIGDAGRIEGECLLEAGRGRVAGASLVDARTENRRILLWSVDRRLPWWVWVAGGIVLAGIVIEGIRQF